MPFDAHQDLLSWSETRPLWMRDVIRRIVVGAPPTDADLPALIQEIKRLHSGSPQATEPSTTFQPLRADDFAGGEAKPSRLLALKNLENVNQISPGQELTFVANGMTAVHGS